MLERRKYPWYQIVTRVEVRLPHSGGWVPPFKGSTVDVSSNGVTVALYEGDDTTKLVDSLLSDGKSLEVALELPVPDGRIRIEGTAKWLDIGPVAASMRYLRVGIFLERMTDVEKAKWEQFVESISDTGAEKPPPPKS